jgi:hypothetical protein
MHDFGEVLIKFASEFVGGFLYWDMVSLPNHHSSTLASWFDRLTLSAFLIWNPFRRFTAQAFGFSGVTD